MLPRWPAVAGGGRCGDGRRLRSPESRSPAAAIVRQPSHRSRRRSYRRAEPGQVAALEHAGRALRSPVLHGWADRHLPRVRTAEDRLR